MLIIPDTARLASVEFVIKNEFLEGKTKIAAFTIEGHTPGMDVHANPNLPIDIALDEIPPSALRTIRLGTDWRRSAGP